MTRTSWWMRLLPGRIFRRYFARVVFPVQVAPLEDKKWLHNMSQGINVGSHPMPTMIILSLTIVLSDLKYLGVLE
jgi:hypothetical protein